MALSIIDDRLHEIGRRLGVKYDELGNAIDPIKGPDRARSPEERARLLQAMEELRRYCEGVERRQQRKERT